MIIQGLIEVSSVFSSLWVSFKARGFAPLFDEGEDALVAQFVKELG